MSSSRWALAVLAISVSQACAASDLVVDDPTTDVESVTLSTSSLVLDVGDSAAVSASPRDALGMLVPTAQVSWTSLAPLIASVSTAGVVRGLSDGSASVVASSQGHEATLSVTVNDTTTPPPPPPPPPPGSLADECQSPQAGWIWCDDFDQDRLSSYFEYDNAGGDFTRQAGVGVEGSTAMRAQFGMGQVGAGSLHLAVGRTPQSYFAPVDAGTADYRELYWRVYLRHAPGWIGGGGDKLSRAFIFASPTTWAQAMIAHVWSGSPGDENFLSIDPASGTDVAGNLVTTTYNDSANLRWLGLRYSTTPIFDAAHVGQWYCIEARAKLNDAGTSNGEFQLWIDEQLEAENTGMNWVGSFNAYGINAVFLENYWNNGSPAAQERYIDNFVVSTQPIGCG